jgi:hypothetical protein
MTTQDHAARAVVIARQLQEQGRSARDAAKVAVGLLRHHDANHVGRRADRACPYCVQPRRDLTWT